MRIGLAGEETAAGACAARALRAAGHALGEPGPEADVLLDAASAGGGAAALPGLLALAEASGARVVLLSTVRVYAGAGEEWIEAADPVINPGSGAGHVPDLELAVFASGARFLVLRLGLLEAPGPGGAWVPRLDPEDLGAWVARAVALDLNGVYDAVTRCERGAADASRRVSGAALARAAA